MHNAMGEVIRCAELMVILHDDPDFEPMHLKGRLGGYGCGSAGCVAPGATDYLLAEKTVKFESVSKE